MKLALSRGCYVALRCVSCEWEANKDFNTVAEMRAAAKAHLKQSPVCAVALRCVSCEWGAGKDFNTVAEMRAAAKAHLKESPECAIVAPHPDARFEFAQGGSLDVE